MWYIHCYPAACRLQPSDGDLKLILSMHYTVWYGGMSAM